MVEELKMHYYLFHWLSDPTPEKAQGYSIADAFRRSGYGGGALKALDWWEEVDSEWAVKPAEEKR